MLLFAPFLGHTKQFHLFAQKQTFSRRELFSRSELKIPFD